MSRTPVKQTKRVRQAGTEPNLKETPPIFVGTTDIGDVAKPPLGHGKKKKKKKDGNRQYSKQSTQQEKL